MPRIRYIQDPETHELVLAEDYVPRMAMRSHNRIVGDSHYDGLQATDGADISSRTKHRRYMRENNLTTMDDFKETWSRARDERVRYLKEGGSVRASDVARAIAKLERGR